jgi:hypothetical protein
MSIGDGERITTRAITCTEVAFEVVISENGSEYGVVRRFSRWLQLF